VRRAEPFAVLAVEVPVLQVGDDAPLEMEDEMRVGGQVQQPLSVEDRGVELADALGSASTSIADSDFPKPVL